MFPPMQELAVGSLCSLVSAGIFKADPSPSLQVQNAHVLHLQACCKAYPSRQASNTFSGQGRGQGYSPWGQAGVAQCCSSLKEGAACGGGVCSKARAGAQASSTDQGLWQGMLS